jgi:hypothetical protein
MIQSVDNGYHRGRATPNRSDEAGCEQTDVISSGDLIELFAEERHNLTWSNGG